MEPSAEKMREWVNRAMEQIVPYLQSLPDQPAAVWQGGADVARSLRESMPEVGSELEPLLKHLFQQVIPHSLNTAGPGYLAYIPGGGLFHTALADLIADAVNRYVGVWIASPGMVQLESNVVQWFCEVVGYGNDPTAGPGATSRPDTEAATSPNPGGILTSGGSIANLTALVTARRTQLGDDFSRGTLYVSDQIHHSITKAAIIAGLPTANVRVIPAGADFKMDVARLQQQIQDDRKDGWQPFLMIGSAGTVNTGAVDPLNELADLAAAESMWLHIDGAYGAFFTMTKRGRSALDGMDRADSITLDPHKSLFLPYGTGCLLVKDGAKLRQAHSVSGDYMPAYQDEVDLVDFCNSSAELSRSNRGLRCWLPIKMLGMQAFRNALDEKLDLARDAADRLRHLPDVKIVAEPELSLLAFRIERSDLNLHQLNQLNQSWIDAVNQRGHVYLTGTWLDGKFTLRICVLCFRTHQDRMDLALQDLAASAAELLATV
ncbi:MAG: aminotransferase class V-fold PLP-dependent enzyme [Planctomycetes bacterium]|nr:aminotransferase class V-fold PLP-dependent enzyme [Planctomycetota bacterium]